MKHNNKGFSLMELISAIAILSIVAISAFTLLMFSINSNNLIVSGSAASQDAELLNKRLEVYFQDAFVDVEENIVTFYTKSEDNEGVVTYSPTEDRLYCEDNSLYFDQASSRQLLQDNLSAYKVETIDHTNLIKITYSIGDHQFTKLFRVKLVPKEITP